MCFTSFITPGATLEYWDFGDGTTSTEQNPCHVYPEEGDYTVSMWVSGVQISRTIRIQFNGTPEPPLLAAGGVCSMDGVATFTISNSGGSMTVADTYVVTNAASVELARGTFQLGPGDSVTVQVAGSGVINAAHARHPTGREHGLRRAAGHADYASTADRAARDAAGHAFADHSATAATSTAATAAAGRHG